MPVFKYANMPVARPGPNMLRREAHSDHLMMTVIDFVDGPSPAVPPHRHPHEQISYVVAGRVRFILGEGEERTATLVEAGDVIVVPPDVPHAVETLTETARLIDCFYPLREDFL